MWLLRKKSIIKAWKIGRSSMDFTSVCCALAVQPRVRVIGGILKPIWVLPC